MAIDAPSGRFAVSWRTTAAWLSSAKMALMSRACVPAVSSKFLIRAAVMAPTIR